MSRYRKSWSQVIEEVYLGEALKPKDKKVIDAFYKEDSLVGNLLSTDGKSLEKHGMGGQTIAAWLNGKIAITAVSDVKSTEAILNYMKKSIPKGNFDPKSYKKFFEEVEIDEKFAGWIAFYNKKKLEIKPKKGEIDSLYDAKQAAIKHFKVPKSKQGLLAIEPAHEEVELVEKDVAVPSSIENLKQIVKDKQNAVFMFKDGKVRVDLFSASALVQVYDALKPATKKKFEDMIKTKGGFVKSVDFAFSMAKK